MGARISQPLVYILPLDKNELTKREEIFLSEYNMSLSKNYVNDEFIRRRELVFWSTQFHISRNSGYIGQII